MIDIEKYSDLPQQGSPDWQRLRLGNFNASRISELMGKGKKKEEYWSKTALSYINEVAAERSLDMMMVANDDEFLEYLELVAVDNRYTRWGHLHEYEARDIYEAKHGVKVTEVSSIKHPDIDHYACSSDGLCIETNSGIEIKCPLPKTYWEWYNTIHDAASLKVVKPEYYWQVIAQIDICDLDYVDFTPYCPLMAKPIFEVRIARDDDAIAQLRERVIAANEVIAAVQPQPSPYNESTTPCSQQEAMAQLNIIE